MVNLKNSSSRITLYRGPKKHKLAVPKIVFTYKLGYLSKTLLSFTLKFEMKDQPTQGTSFTYTLLNTAELHQD